MAARFLVAGGNGNWNDTSNWSATTGGASGASFPVAADSVTFDTASANANMTVNVASACSAFIMSGTYAGTLTFNSTLTITSTCTFVSTCTIAGTTGTLIQNSLSATMTSGGKTLTCALTLSGSGAAYVMGDNWTVNGLVSIGSVSGAGLTSNKITCAGGLSILSSGTISGNMTLEITGGTWSFVSTAGVRNNVNLNGNVTISGAITYNTGTLRYLGGTITTTGSTLTAAAVTTFDTAGVTWNNVTLSGAVTYALTSALAWSGTLSLLASAGTTFTGAALSGTGSVAFGASGGSFVLNNTGGLTTTGTMTLANANVSFSGSAGYTVGTLTTATLTGTRTHTLGFGNTYTVTTALSNVGTGNSLRQLLKSSSPGNKVVFKLSPGASQSLTYCDPTDIDSSGGDTITSTNGVLTNTVNWLDGISRYLVAGGTGNWNSTSNWSVTSGGSSGASFPVTGSLVVMDSNSGNANVTLNVSSACTSLIMSGTYAGTLTFDNNLTIFGTCTFVSTCTIAGTAGTLIVTTGGQTLTSGGKTLTCALTFTTAGVTYTLADNWTVNGLVTLASANTTYNGFRFTCAGGLRLGGAAGNAIGTTTIVITGGTWDSTSTGSLSKDVDLQGNVTISGSIAWGTTNKTLKYVSGTITTTGSTITATTSTIWDTAGVIWNNLSLTGSIVTYSLTSALNWSGTLIIGSNNTVVFDGAALSGTGAVTLLGTTLTFSNTGGLVTTGTATLPNTALTLAGVSGFTVGTLTTAALTASRILQLTVGASYAVTNTLTNVGTTPAIRQTIKSGNPGNKVVFTLARGAACNLVYCDPTDIDSSGGAQVVSINGVITTTLNWANSLTAGGTGGTGVMTNPALTGGTV